MIGTVRVGKGRRVLTISIRANIDEARRALFLDQKEFERELPKALNFTAAETRKVLRAEMERVFEAPTRFTLNGMFVQQATVARPEAAVFFKDFAPKGTPAGKYLLAEVEGGARRQKRSERAFGLAGLAGNRGFWVPGAGAPLDANGNIPGPVMVRILADVKAFAEVGFVGNRTKSSTRRNKRYRQTRYFVAGPGSHLAPGVWERDGRTVKPILIFVAEASYRKRFDFFGVGETFARARFPIELDNALRRIFKRQAGR